MSPADTIAQLSIAGTAGRAEKAANSPAPADAQRLKALAAQFEAVLVAQMLQQMRASMFDDGDSGGTTSAPLADSLFAELSLALCRAGGVGLADSMVTPLVRQTGEDGVPAAEPASLAAPAGGLALPTPAMLIGPVSSAYGWRRDPIDGSMRFHRGLDLALPEGSPVPSPQAGRVTFAGELAGYGLTVVLDHGDQLTTRFAHLSEIAVQVGDDVSEGQIIARTGATGRATGPHLHFEVMEAGQNVNPAEKLATYTAGRPQ